MRLKRPYSKGIICIQADASSQGYFYSQGVVPMVLVVVEGGSVSATVLTIIIHSLIS